MAINPWDFGQGQRQWFGGADPGAFQVGILPQFMGGSTPPAAPGGAGTTSSTTSTAAPNGLFDAGVSGGGGGGAGAGGTGSAGAGSAGLSLSGPSATSGPSAPSVDIGPNTGFTSGFNSSPYSGGLTTPIGTFGSYGMPNVTNGLNIGGFGRGTTSTGLAGQAINAASRGAFGTSFGGLPGSLANLGISIFGPMGMGLANTALGSLASTAVNANRASLMNNTLGRMNVQNALADMPGLASLSPDNPLGLNSDPNAPFSSDQGFSLSTSPGTTPAGDVNAPSSSDQGFGLAGIGDEGAPGVGGTPGGTPGDTGDAGTGAGDAGTGDSGDGAGAGAGGGGAGDGGAGSGAGAGGAGGGAGDGAGGPFKRGGLVKSGKLNSKTDDVPAKLQRGEFVVNRAAAQRFAPELSQINRSVRPSGGMSVGPRRKA